jgi:hypothetical protein
MSIRFVVLWTVVLILVVFGMTLAHAGGPIFNCHPIKLNNKADPNPTLNITIEWGDSVFFLRAAWAGH